MVLGFVLKLTESVRATGSVHSSNCAFKKNGIDKKTIKIVIFFMV